MTSSNNIEPDITSIDKMIAMAAVQHGYIYLDRSGNYQIDYGKILLDKMREVIDDNTN